MIKNAKFITSVGSVSQMRDDFGIEIAVAGKSNVGKSSFINMLCNQKKLAKTSKEPGRTRLLNYFDINNGEFVLVDLPGYGFARVSDAEKEKWSMLIERYFQTSQSLAHVFMLVDVRHNPTVEDMNMLKYLYYYNIPFTILTTKADKLSRQAMNNQRRIIANYIGVGVENIICTSATNRTGMQEVFDRIDSIIDFRKNIENQE